MLAGRATAQTLGALFTLAMMVAGCSDDEPDASSTTTSSTTSSSAPSTTGTTDSTSTTATTGGIDATGVEGPAEWAPVVVDVYERIHRLDTDPDPARVTEVYSENFEGLADERETIQFLANEGLHAEGPAPRIIRIEGPTDEAGSTSQQFVVTVEYFPFRLVREDGTVFQEIDDVPGVVEELLRISPSGADGAWRVLVKTSA